jgi:hypothetical protein
MKTTYIQIQAAKNNAAYAGAQFTPFRSGWGLEIFSGIKAGNPPQTPLINQWPIK